MARTFQQKWIDFFRSQQYFLLGEFLYVYFFITIFSLSIKNVIIYSMSFFLLWFINALIFVQRPSKPKDPNFFNPFHPIPEFVEKTIKTADGYTITYRIASDASSSVAEKDKKIVLLATPLGQQGPSIYYPFLCQLGTKDYIYISWDYRGFWKSQHIEDENEECTKDRIRETSIFEFARDANRILLAEGIDCVDVMIGHSLGVQVTLEFSVLYPKKLRSMILLNGSHGTVFHTAFQLIIRIPFVGDLTAELVAFLLKHKSVLETARTLLFQPYLKLVIVTFTTFAGDEKLCARFGVSYLYRFCQQYIGGICENETSMYQFLRQFQELHSHSVLHLLHRIETPTLIISGFWDPLLPAIQSYEMARKLRKCRHVCCTRSTHATILERPETTVFEMVKFMEYMDKRQYKVDDDVDLQDIY